MTWVLYENPDGFNSWISGNEKLDKGREMIDELEANVVAYSKTQLNDRHCNNVRSLSQMFQGGESEIKLIHGHNVHKNVGPFQRGGTGLLLYSPLINTTLKCWARMTRDSSTG